MKSLTEIEAVKVANEQFYRAFETLDIDRMSAVWSDDYEVTCIHPGWPLIRGRADVIKSWARIFDNTMVMQFTITEVAVHVENSWAWVVCTESLRSVVDGRVNEGKIEATNIWHKHSEQWLIVHHHGSSVME